jgi:hypothetical protein
VELGCHDEGRESMVRARAAGGLLIIFPGGGGANSFKIKGEGMLEMPQGA